MSNIKISELPVATNVLSTDLFAIVQSGGTRQTTLGAIPFTHSGTAPSSRDTQTKIRELGRGGADHTGYDATGATDSYTAIANAIASMSDGETLYLTGTPLIGTTLTINKRIEIVFRGGAGSSSGVQHGPSSYLSKKASLNGPAILITTPGVRLSGGGIIGIAGNGGAGVVVRANSVVARDFYVKGMGTYGFHIDHASASDNCNSFKFDSCVAESNTSHGFYVDSATSGNANVGKFTKCQSLSNGGDGFKSNFGFWNTYDTCIAELNTGWGANFSNGKDNTWLGGDPEANTAGQIQIQSTESGLTLLQKPAEQSITDNGYYTKRLDRAYSKRGTWSPALYGASGGDKTITAVSISGSTATITSAAHGYSNSDSVFQTGMPSANLEGVFVISNVAVNTYDITVRTDRSVTPPSSASGLSATVRKCGAYSLQVGRYTYRDGRVEFDVALTTSSLTNISGNVYLLLPFPTEAITSLYTVASIGYHSGITYTKQLKAMPNQNGNWFCELWMNIDGTPSAPALLQGTGLGTPTLLYMSGSFYVAQAA